MILPPMPLRLKRSFVWMLLLGGTTLALLGVAIMLGSASWQYTLGLELRDEEKVWLEGIPAERCEVTARYSTTKFIFHQYTLDVIFSDHNLTEYVSQVVFYTVWDEIDESKLPIVRYLKSDPSRFAVSWAVDLRTSRWITMASFVIMGFVCGGAFVSVGCNLLRRLSDASRCARRGEEILVRLKEITRQVANGIHTRNEFHYEGQTADGHLVSGKAVFRIKQEPLFADRDKGLLIALVAWDDPRRIVILRDDLHPYELSEEEIAGVRQRISIMASMASRETQK